MRETRTGTERCVDRQRSCKKSNITGVGRQLMSISVLTKEVNKLWKNKKSGVVQGPTYDL